MFLPEIHRQNCNKNAFLALKDDKNRAQGGEKTDFWPSA
jgi:hypothetical protein